MDIVLLNPAQKNYGHGKADQKNCYLDINISGLEDNFLKIFKNQSLFLSVKIKYNHSGLEGVKKIIVSGFSQDLKKMFIALNSEQLNTAHKKIIKKVQTALENYHKINHYFKCGNYKIDLSKKTKIMGILNVTPDSFSDGGEYFSQARAIEHALQMQAEGADIIDIGAESTRPGSKPVAASVQIKRVEEIVRILGKRLRIPISIDTANSVVARRCLDLGASIINDIFGLRKDKKLGKLVARYKAGIVLMHMHKNPLNMQKNPVYEDLIAQISGFLAQAKKRALSAGIDESGILIDPGVGFGKTTEHNLKIIKFLECFKILGQPILIGTSRKSFIGNVLNVPVSERELGTAVSVVLSVLNGASIVRVHNVKQMKQVITLTQAIKKQKV